MYLLSHQFTSCTGTSWDTVCKPKLAGEDKSALMTIQKWESSIMKSSHTKNKHQYPVIVSHFQIKNLHFQVKDLSLKGYTERAQLFIHFPNCTHGSKTVQKLYTPPQTQKIHGHHYNTGADHKIKRWPGRSQNCEPAAGHDSPLSGSALLCRHTVPKDHFSEVRICRQHRAADHRQAHESKQTFRWVQFKPWGFMHTDRSRTDSLFTHYCCFPCGQEHRALILRQ